MQLLSAIKNGVNVQDRSWKLEDAKAIANEIPYTLTELALQND